MKAHFCRRQTLVGALVAMAGVASSAGAQQIVAFGAAEFSGPVRRNVQLLGFAVSSGQPGWSPVLTVTGLRFAFPDGLGGTADAFAIAPSPGMRFQTQTGSTGLHVGYLFVNEDDDDFVTGSPVGGSDGVFATFQADYWGQGDRIGQAIATYNFGGNYLWSRLKGGTRFGSLTSPLFVGAEVIFQGGGEDDDLDIPNSWVLQAGPVLMFQLTPNFRLDLSGGIRAPIDDPADEPLGGYGRIEFVAVLPQLFGFFR